MFKKLLAMTPAERDAAREASEREYMSRLAQRVQQRREAVEALLHAPGLSARERDFLMDLSRYNDSTDLVPLGRSLAFLTDAQASWLEAIGARVQERPAAKPTALHAGAAAQAAPGPGASVFERLRALNQRTNPDRLSVDPGDERPGTEDCSSRAVPGGLKP